MLRALVDARDAVAPSPRGWGRYVKQLVTALADEPGLDLRLATRGWPGPEALFELAGLPLKALRCDVLHAPNCFLPPRRRCAGVVTIHDLAFEDHPEDFARATGIKYRAWTPRAARSAQRVIAPSQFTKDDVVRRYGVDPGRISVIPEAPALPIGTLEAPPGPYILGVGDLRRKKDWTTLATAYASLRAGGLAHRLVIAGLDAGEGAAIRAAAGKHPLELPGYLPDARLDALMRGADVLVHPSLYEGYGLVLVEAMARGVPVVAARATALPETAGDAALLFEPRNPKELSAAITLALASRDQLIRRGHERVAGLSWQRVAAATVAVYREAAGA